jgi:hypothetical protein
LVVTSKADASFRYSVSWFGGGDVVRQNQFLGLIHEVVCTFIGVLLLGKGQVNRFWCLRR